MAITCDIIKLSPVEKSSIDYDMAVFSIRTGKRIDIDNSREYVIFLTTIIEGGAKKILIDFHDLEYIDSSGIGLFIAAAKQVRAREGDLIICNVSSEIMGIFKIVNLQDFIKMFSTDGEAVNHYRMIT